MKNIRHVSTGLVLVAVASIITPCPGHAAEKCLWLDTSGNSICTAQNTGFNQIDWAATCSHTNSGITKSTQIRGIGVCSNMSGENSSTHVTTSDKITVSEKEDENTNCWCKMTEPAVSKWVFQWNYAGFTTGECFYLCANSCTADLGDDIDTNTFLFRKQMFSSLSSL